MCGIAGFVFFDPAHPVDERELRGMTAAIRHRGPDDEGVFVGGPAGLAMRRLSIIDVAGGHQPIFNEDRTVAIVFNGEIYNYLELRAELEARGHRFATRSDTEAIVHAYEEWGGACPEHLRGMFAFAVWDARTRTLFIARDRLGKKPLYYFRDGRRLVFGSEIKSLLTCRDVPRAINIRALDAYLTLGYVPAPDTLFDGIAKLPPGHSLRLSGADLTVRPYWDLRFDVRPATGSDDNQRAQVRQLLEESVRIRLMSDVPLGAFLSGGIDSSVIVGLMTRMLDKPVETFSVGFEEEAHNELPYAGIIARHFQTSHHEIVVNDCTPAMMDRLVWHLDEPLSDPAAVPTLIVSDLARRHVTVVLTGEGGDELFAGYDYYRTDRRAMSYRVLPPALSRALLPAAARAANTLLGRQRYHQRTIWHWALPASAGMLAWVAVFTDDELARVCTRALSERLVGAAADVFSTMFARCAARDRLHRLMYTDTKVWLPDDLLMKVDKMSMAASIEARTPFLDHVLMEYVASIPARSKLRGDVPKLVVKQIAEEFLPREIIHRPKHTFDVPVGKWLLGPLHDLTRDIVRDGVLPGVCWFDADYILGPLWNDLVAGKPGVARQLWSLLNLGLWARRFDVRSA